MSLKLISFFVEDDINDNEVEMGEFCGDALEDLETLGSYTDSTGTYVVHCEGH